MVLRQKVPGLAGSFPDKCPLLWISFLFLGVPRDLSGLAANACLCAHCRRESWGRADR